MSEVLLNDVKNRNSLFDYLLIADESEEIVKRYMNHGEMFAICFQGKTVGVCLFTIHPDQVVEIKNIALDKAYRGRGIGKQVIDQAILRYQKNGYKKMIVGTANSSIGNLVFYQKAGFRMYEIKTDFFAGYPEPIYENGIEAIDLVLFKLDLTQ